MEFDKGDLENHLSSWDVHKQIIRRAGERIKEFSTGFFQSVYVLNACATFQVTYSILEEKKLPRRFPFPFEESGSSESLGVVAGIITDLAEVGALGYLAFTDRPEYLLIPVGTNVVSGVYELYVKSRDQARLDLLNKDIK